MHIKYVYINYTIIHIKTQRTHTYIHTYVYIRIQRPYIIHAHVCIYVYTICAHNIATLCISEMNIPRLMQM